MRQLAAVLALVATIAILLPLVAVEAQSAAYEISVQAGSYYAVRLSVNARGVYDDGSSVPVYRWDLNSSYVIFYAPRSGKVYLFESSISNTVLSTRDWFYSPTSNQTIYFSVYVNYTTPAGGAVADAGAVSASVPNTAISSVVFNGTHIVATVQNYNATISFSDKYVTYSPSSLYLVTTTTSPVTTTVVAYIHLVPAGAVISSANGSLTGVRMTLGAASDQAYTCRDQYGYTYAFYVNGYTTQFTYNSTRIVFSAAPSFGTSYQNTQSQMTIYFSASAWAVVSFNSTISAVNGTLTASNGNKIVVVDNPPPAQVVNVQKASVNVYASQLSISTNSTGWIVIAAQKPSTIPDSAFNPALLTTSINLGYYTVLNNTYYMFFNTTASGSAWLVWNFPQSIARSTKYDYSNRSLNEYVVTVSGTALYGSGVYMFTNATVSFYSFNRVIYVNITGSYNSTLPVISVNGTLFYFTKPGSVISGSSFNIYDYVVDITPPAPVSLNGSVYVNYTVGSSQLISIPLEVAVVMTAASGSWGYRIPVYVTLGGTPMGLPVLRLELPLGTWVKQGLLSPGLEDLLIVDWENKPVYFYISHWESNDNAVVYVRLNKPPPSSTFTLYILLQNRALWGTGITYSSIMTFDFVKPQLPLSIYGLYNTFALRPLPQWIRLYTTQYDYVTYYLNGTLVECHGSFCATYSIQPILGGQELFVRVDNTSFSVFVDGDPAFSLDLGSLTYYQNVSFKTIYFVEYSTTDFSSHFHSVPFTYSIGYLQGGVYVAPQYNPQPQTEAPVQEYSPWGTFFNVLPMLLILVILGVVMKFIQGRESPQPSPGVNLP